MIDLRKHSKAQSAWIILMMCLYSLSLSHCLPLFLSLSLSLYIYIFIYIYHNCIIIVSQLLVPSVFKLVIKCDEKSFSVLSDNCAMESQMIAEPHVKSLLWTKGNSWPNMTLTKSHALVPPKSLPPWWRHQMETFSAWLALCAGNSPVPVNSRHEGQWRRALMFSLIYTWINDWELRRHRGHYDIIVM